MEMLASQYPALKTEVTTDPKALGLVAMTDDAAAAKLNQVGASAEVLSDRKVLESWEVMNAIDPTEWSTVNASHTPAQKEWFDDLISSGKVDASNARIRAGLGAMFPAGAAPVTRAALLALIDRSCSRAEKVFGAGAFVQYFDVARARAL